VLSVLWSLFSLLSVLLYRYGKAGADDLGVSAAFAVWSTHAVLALVTAILWLWETPREVDVTKTTPDVR
jgi:hypothetical protein